LGVVVQHIFDVDRIYADVHHAIAAIHGVALAGDEDVFTLREKDFLALAGVISKSEELQIDGLFVERTSLDGGICLARVVSRAAGCVRCDLALQVRVIHLGWRRINLGFEDVAAFAFVLDIFYCAEQV